MDTRKQFQQSQETWEEEGGHRKHDDLIDDGSDAMMHSQGMHTS